MFGVEAEHLQALQGLAVGIVVAVVVYVAAAGVVLGVAPLAIGAVVALDRSRIASDPVFQLGDLGVGSRQHRVLKGRAEQGDSGRRDQGRHRQPEQAEAKGLGGHDLIALRKEAESDQSGHQDEDRRHVVEDLQRKIGVVDREDARWDVVLEHLVDELGEVRHDVYGESREDRNHEDPHEDAEDVAVHDTRETKAERFDPQPQPGPGGGAAQRERLGLSTRETILERTLPAAPDLPPSAETQDSPPDVLPQVAVDRADHQALVPVSAPEQKRAENEEEDVWRPHRQPGRDLPVHGRFLSVAQHDVVEEEHRDRDQEARGPAAAAVPEAEGNPVEAEHEAGARDRELLVDLDQGLVALVVGKPGFFGALDQLRKRHRAHALGQHQPLVVAQQAVLDHDVRIPEALQPVGTGIIRVHLMHVGETEHQDRGTAVARSHVDAPGFAYDDLLFGTWNGVGQEHAAPAVLVLGRLEDVEHALLEAVVEHPGLDLLVHTPLQDRQLQFARRLVARRQSDGHQVCGYRGQQQTHEQDRPVDREQADSRGPHGNQLAVGSHPADGQQDGEQERHRNRQDDDLRQVVREELEHDPNLDVALDDQFGELEELLQQGEEREHEKAQGEWANRLAHEVAVEEAEHRDLRVDSDRSERVRGSLAGDATSLAFRGCCLGPW